MCLTSEKILVINFQKNRKNAGIISNIWRIARLVDNSKFSLKQTEVNSFKQLTNKRASC